MAYGYEGQIPQQEMIGVGDVAGAMLNPVNWYKYNPSMWSMRRGQVRVPFVSGSNIRNVAGKIRKYGGAQGNRFVDFVKNKSGLNKLGGVMASESIWVGSAPMASDDIFGYTIKGPGARTSNMIKGAKAQQASRDAFGQAFGPRPTSNYVAPTSRMPRGYHPPPFTPSESIVAAAKYGDDQIAYVNRNWKTLNEQGFNTKGKRWGYADRLYDRGYRTGKALARGTEKTYSALGRAIKPIAKMGMRVATTAGKGFAYYQIASLMYSVTQMAFEPLGRKAISTVDSIFNAKSMIRSPELGGNLSMAYLTRGAATERQRALQAIQKSRLNARQALGNEAALKHM